MFNELNNEANGTLLSAPVMMVQPSAHRTNTLHVRSRFREFVLFHSICSLFNLLQAIKMGFVHQCLRRHRSLEIFLASNKENKNEINVSNTWCVELLSEKSFYRKMVSMWFVRTLVIESAKCSKSYDFL